eukprot:SAG31_NODE_47217_length_251_cov_0.684211_1_plen_66_part_01
MKAAEVLLELGGNSHERAELSKLVFRSVEFKTSLELDSWRTVAEPGLIVRSAPSRENPTLVHLSVF